MENLLITKTIPNHISFISFPSRFPSPFSFPLFSLISNSFPSRGIAKGNERESRPEGNDPRNPFMTETVKENRWSAEGNENPFMTGFSSATGIPWVWS